MQGCLALSLVPGPVTEPETYQVFTKDRFVGIKSVWEEGPFSKLVFAAVDKMLFAPHQTVSP